MGTHQKDYRQSDGVWAQKISYGQVVVEYSIVSFCKQDEWKLSALCGYIV